ncbi:MAG: hypothetical protein ACK4TO_06565, partial [Candidatus Nitrosotenuis sp.]
MEQVKKNQPISLAEVKEILEKLKAYIVVKAKVRRQGKIEIVERRNLVPGDIVIFEAGDIIPAD